MRAIEILERAKDENGNVPMSLVRKAFEKTKPYWIPCSEMLPEREGRYLVTNSAWGSWTVDVCAWIGHWHSDDKPIAWMPLPAPYGGESNG